MMTSRLLMLSGSFCPRTRAASSSHDAGLRGLDSIWRRFWVERPVGKEGSLGGGMEGAGSAHHPL